jgi:FHA domain
MSVIEGKLLKIESRLQVLVEGAADRLFPGARISDLLAHNLMLAVRGGLHLMPDGYLVAPDHLALLVCPSELDLFSSPRWLGEIETALRTLGGEQGLRFPPGHFLQVESRTQLAPGEVLVAPCDENGKVADVGSVSQTTDVEMAADGSQDLPSGAFLIVDGMQVYPIDQPVLNLGRRPDNHLVIDDSRVSRTHAQLRLVRDQFIIFDLESSGGTYVNGKRVTQQVLHPGDVISLAGVPVVFGQDTPGLGQTQEYSPTS